VPIILHEGTGLTIRKNDKNGFTVVTLHHTADPNKRSPDWRRESAAGMTPEKFAREYDIDYTAVMGAKVFPEFTTLRSDIIVTGELPDFGRGVRYWGGFDYGTRNPASFHVYTIVDGIIYVVWELFHPCKNIPEFVGEMQSFPYWDQIRYIAADPNLWAKTNPTEDGTLISIQDIFYRNGVRNLIRGLQDEEAWMAVMRGHWSSPDTTFKIFHTCPNMIREFETAIYVNQSEKQLLSTNYREALADIDNHSLDDCKYFINSKPTVQQQSTWKDPIMVSRFGPGRGPTSRPTLAPALSQKTDGRGYLTTR